MCLDVCLCICVCGSVLMADVTGLTALSQDCSAAEVVRMLNELFGRFDQLAAVCCRLLLYCIGSTAAGSGVGRYVIFTPMWEQTICGFRAGWCGYAASLLCRHISVIKNSDFVAYSKFGIWTTSVFGGSIMWIASYTCCLFSG